MFTILEYLLFLLLLIVTILLIAKIRNIKKLQKKLKELSVRANILRQYNKATKTSNIISNADLKGNITYVNNKFCEVSQYSRREILGRPHNILRAEEDDEVFKDLWKTIKSGNVWRGNLKNRKKDGTFYHINTIISPIYDENGQIFEYVAIRHEITDLVEKTAELNKILREDYLTKIGSRYKLIEDIAKKDNPVIALIDINNFSEINDFFGYKIGDNILRLIAKTIEDLFINKKNYEVYRLTADIFAILSVNVDQNEFIKEVSKATKKLTEKPFSARGREIYLQLNQSFSFESKDTLLETANVIRKYSKRNKNNIIYNKDFDIEKDYEKNIFWTQKIKKALEKDGVFPYFQAIYNIQTQRIEKYEALMRLNDGGKVVPPFFFLDISKKSGQYLQLTKQMVKKTFEYFKNNEYEFSINLTFQDISNEIISSYILNTIKVYGFGSRVVIEIVESEEIKNFSIVNNFIEEIRSLGCKIAIDDFGSGYSNFEYLIKLNADYIKIDGSLIKDILVNNGNENIVKMIIKFAKDQGIKTIAEFVSSKEIFDKVKELGVDYVQGYYIKEPEASI
ncbi:bifunctional diguanylate cyclase/phosphodiesterase [Aliarcobacter vitoriensis]|uniref:bifunctional diguanylate cyclase/phosphodiesterase n=1 Tax=Aliarcobacter vitoriensis TaxID=2011099 RepID=UPI001F1B4C44|nr:EAL domain-containing protein [Aliarcobacter vitoriensis]